jgi:hypothetical protein
MNSDEWSKLSASCDTARLCRNSDFGVIRMSGLTA